jgi:hypothetical protein
VNPPNAAVPSAPGSCGSVTAASGLTLQVLDGEAGGVDCATATQIVERFQRKIAGKQPADSNEPLSDAVDGWLCVSGPPTAEGRTTCGKDNQNIFAAAIPVE